MSDRFCPDCGRPNPPEAENCRWCNFPLRGAPGSGRAASAAAPRDPGAPLSGAPAAPVEPPVPRVPLRRPVRRAAPLGGQSVSLWLLFGAIGAGVIVFEAVRANLGRMNTPARIEGSSDAQQQAAEAAEQVLARDSSDVEARIRLANVLYDTHNWSDAIVHYRAAIRMDSTRVPPFVDLGVCYYNLGDTREAEQLFRQALARDPHQPVALYNLGVVREQHGEKGEALEYYRRSLASQPDPTIQAAVEAGIQRLGASPGGGSH